MIRSRCRFVLGALGSQSSKPLLPGHHYGPFPLLAPALHTRISRSESTTSNGTQRSGTTFPPKTKDSTSLRPTARVNPSTSTLPPPLALPERKIEETGIRTLKFYYRTGEAYLTFYKTGVKAIYQNYKILRQLRSRIPPGRSVEQALRDGHLSRAEYHLVRRTRSDVSRIPLFGLVLVVCGEFTPLVVLFLGLDAAVPRICHVPRQIDGARKRQEEARRKSFREGTITGKELVDFSDVSNLPKPILAHVANSLGLVSGFWNVTGITPRPLVSWRLRKAVDRIDADDFAIDRDGGAKHLNEEELKLAAEARGIDVVGRPVGGLRSDLYHWADARKHTPMIHLFCTRPSAWPRTKA
ncbi:MAG: hypothetical protein Q9183_000058 [Haloplaca sp. 2 TL-2023]